MDPEVIGVLAGIVTIICGILAALKYGRRILRRLWHGISRYKPKIPRETLRILPCPNGCWWGEGSVRGQPAMQVVAEWRVTNITDLPVRLLRVHIERPHAEGSIFTCHPERNIFGEYSIAPGRTAEATSLFWVVPPVQEVGKSFSAAVVVTDQFGNEHKLKRVVFRGPRPQIKKRNVIPAEPLYAICHPIEKDVAAVLKAEVNQYSACGRGVGGLGSIQTTIFGQTHKGIGTEWREADSPKNQSIVEDENGVIISSDNAQALLKLYSSLKNEEEKQLFHKSLLDRVSRTKEYASVGYLILYVMFSIGMLKEVLNQAKKELQGDEGHGFSDFLRFLDGLLRFRHSSFSNEMLDHIERTVEDIDEHAFRIPERLAAIRTYRLRRKDE